MSDLAARNGGRAGLALLVAILVLGLGLRVAEAWDGRSPVYDAVAYERIATNLGDGKGFTLGASATQPASNYSPGMPLVAGGLYAIAGHDERLARLVFALIGSLAVLFTYLIGRRLSGPFAGLVGAGAVAIYPALLEYQGMLMGEPLAATLLSGAVLAMLWAAGPAALRAGPLVGEGGALRAEQAPSSTPPTPTPPARRWLVPGILLGALALVRPEYVGISVLVAIVVLVRDRTDWRAGLVNAGVLLAGMAIVVAPWTVRNAVALDRFVPVSTGGGQVLFAGSYLPSDGDPERVGEEVLKWHPGLRAQLPDDARLEQILTALAEQRYPGVETDEALGRMGRERLWGAISEEPVEYVGFVAEKVWRVWGHGPRDAMQRTGWELFHWALLALALLGLVLLAWRRRWEALLLGTVLVATATVGALLVGSPRRALVTVPLLAALAGVGATGSYAWLRSRIRH